MKKLIIVVEESDKDKFEKKCHDLLLDNYTMESCSCGFVDSESYDYCGFYQAILKTKINFN